MLLQRILNQLDLELSRLHTLRSIGSDLHREAPRPARRDLPSRAPLTAPLSPVGEDVSAVRIRSLKRKAVRTPRAARPSLLEPRINPVSALSNVIPAAPVIVSRQALEAERALRPGMSRPADQQKRFLDVGETSDVSIRDLTHRWLGESSAAARATS